MQHLPAATKFVFNFFDSNFFGTINLTFKVSRYNIYKWYYAEQDSALGSSVKLPFNQHPMQHENKKFNPTKIIVKIG